MDRDKLLMLALFVKVPTMCHVASTKDPQFFRGF